MNMSNSRRLMLPFILVSTILILLVAITWLLFSRVESSIAPDPVVIASASLDSLQQQNRLTVFTASYNATVTTTITKFGLSARKTLITPGTVRYELDMAKLETNDVRWDAKDNTLYVEMPEIEIAEPQIHVDKIQTYDDGGMLMALTDAEDRLDQSNRTKAVKELAHQAQSVAQLGLARDAARRAVVHNFAIPLQAAGVEAKIDAFFPYERGRYQARWDLSRPIRDILAEKAKKSGSGQ